MRECVNGWMCELNNQSFDPLHSLAHSINRSNTQSNNQWIILTYDATEEYCDEDAVWPSSWVNGSMDESNNESFN